jgi:hypothetical protein
MTPNPTAAQRTPEQPSRRGRNLAGGLVLPAPFSLFAIRLGNSPNPVPAASLGRIAKTEVA